MVMKIKNLMLSGCILATVAFVSCDKNDDEDLNNTDRDYMMRASISNTAEVSAGTVAAGKATNPAVKAFAQFMMTEHTMAQTDLKNLGTNVGFTVRDTIDPAHVAIMTQLNSMSGRAFDSAYIHTQVADHQMTIANFQMELNSGQHRDVRDYANRYLPHIQMHLARADSIARAYFPR
jgi:putative membrane protein